MRLLLALIVFISFFGISLNTTASGVSAIANGDWLSRTTWSCNCVPPVNANVEIPEGIIVTISKSVVHVSPTIKVTITIRGLLLLAGTSLYLDSDDQLSITSNGSVQSSSPGAAVYFGKMPVFINEKNTIVGVSTISGGKLPPRLIGFKAQPDGKEVCVQWSSVHGFDYEVYTLDRSSDGIHFTTINQQCGINSTPQNFVNCVYYDAQPLEGITYYRLKASRRNQEDAFAVIALTPKETKRTTF